MASKKLTPISIGEWLSYDLACFISFITLCLKSPYILFKKDSIFFLSIFFEIFTIFLYLQNLLCQCRVMRKSFRTIVMSNSSNILSSIMVVILFISISSQMICKNKYYPILFLISNIIQIPRSLCPFLLATYHQNVLIEFNISKKILKFIFLTNMFSLYIAIVITLIGVQMISDLRYACVLDMGMNNSKITLKQCNSMIPVTHCYSPDGPKSFKCPANFVCGQISEDMLFSRIYQFTDLVSAIAYTYTVSMGDDWMNVVTVGADSRNVYVICFYFIFLVYMIAWIGKNIYIASMVNFTRSLYVPTEESWLTKFKTSMDKNRMPMQFNTLSGSEGLPRLFVIRSNRMGVLNLCERFNIKYKVYLSRFIADGTVNRIIGVIIFIDACIMAFGSNMTISISAIIVGLVLLMDCGIRIFVYGWSSFSRRRIHYYYILIMVSSIASGIYSLCYIPFPSFLVLKIIRLIDCFDFLRNYMTRLFSCFPRLFISTAFILFSIGSCSSISFLIFTCLFPDPNLQKLNPFVTYLDSLELTIIVFLQDNVYSSIIDSSSTLPIFHRVFFFVIFMLWSFVFGYILVNLFVGLILENMEPTEADVLHQQSTADILVKSSSSSFDADILWDSIKIPRNKKVSETHVIPARIRWLVAILDGFSCLFGNKSKEPQQKHLQDSEKTNILAFQQEDATVRFTFRSTTPLALSKEKKQNSPYNYNLINRHRAIWNEFQKFSAIDRSYVYESRTLNERKKFLDYTTKKLVSSDDIMSVKYRIRQAIEMRNKLWSNLISKYPLILKSLFYFGSNHPLRLYLIKIVHSKYSFEQSEIDVPGNSFYASLSSQSVKKYLSTQTYLEWSMILLNHISGVSMLFEDGNTPPFKKTPNGIIEHIYIVISTLEIVAKMIADGVIFTPRAYLSTWSNCFSLTFYLGSVMYMISYYFNLYFGNSMSNIPNAFVYIRCMRPLGIITISPPLVKVLNRLFRGWKNIIRVLLMIFVIFTAYALYGYHTYGDNLRFCNDETINSKEQCIGVFSAPVKIPNLYEFNITATKSLPKLMIPRAWKPLRLFRYDTFSLSLSSTFQLMTQENWNEGYKAIYEKFSIKGSFYVLSFIILSYLIGLTMILAVVVQSFNENRGKVHMTMEQSRWEAIKKMLKMTSPLKVIERPSSVYRATVYNFMNSGPFNMFYVFVIILSMLMFSVAWNDETQSSINSLRVVATCCLLVFILKSIMELYCMEKTFFEFKHKIVGLINSVASLISIILMHNSFLPSLVKIGDAICFWVCILQSLLMAIQVLMFRSLFNVLLVSMLRSFYALSVFVLCTQTYVMIGVSKFGSTRFGFVSGRHENFKNVISAFILLLRVTSGDNWNHVMEDYAIEHPYCTSDPKLSPISDCGDVTFAHIFFISYTIIITYMLLNIFIALVLESFFLYFGSITAKYTFNQDDITDFQLIWSKIDKSRLGSLPYDRVCLVVDIYRVEKKLNSVPDRFVTSLIKEEIKKICKITGSVSFHQTLYIVALWSIDMNKSLTTRDLLSRQDDVHTFQKTLSIKIIFQWARMTRQIWKTTAAPDSSGMNLVVSDFNGSVFPRIVF